MIFELLTLAVVEWEIRLGVVSKTHFSFGLVPHALGNDIFERLGGPFGTILNSKLAAS